MPRNEPFLDPGCYRREGFRSLEHKTGRRIPVRTIIINRRACQINDAHLSENPALNGGPYAVSVLGGGTGGP